MKWTVCTAASLLATLAALTAHATTTSEPLAPAQFNVHLTLEHFRWNEYTEGTELLEERGPLFGIGISAVKPLNPKLDFEGRGRLFFGTVDYDGAVFAADGSSIPYKSDTLYRGIELEGDLATTIPTSSGLDLRPFAGLGLRYWLRSLDTKSDGKTGEFGYDEYWATFQVIAGLEARISSFYARGSIRAPFYNHESVDFGSGSSDVNLEPGKRVSLAGELGYQVSRYTIALYAESLEFSKSDFDDKTGMFFQPESKARIYGLRAGLNF